MLCTRWQIAPFQGNLSSRLWKELLQCLPCPTAHLGRLSREQKQIPLPLSSPQQKSLKADASGEQSKISNYKNSSWIFAQCTLRNHLTVPAAARCNKSISFPLHPAVVSCRGLLSLAARIQGTWAAAAPNAGRFVGPLRLGAVCAPTLPDVLSSPSRAGAALPAWASAAQKKQISSLHLLGVRERLCSFDRNICVELSEGFFHLVGLTSWKESMHTAMCTCTYI